MSSILFDDLNDQEFNEALEEFYKSNSETKATNLFEQSFEDRLKSNESLINEDTEYFLLEEEIKRSELPDSIFGVPEQRKYPLDSEKHVRSAIKLFNYVDPKYEAGLARKIKRKMKEYNITDINVGEANRFNKYYHPSKKAVNEGWLVLDPSGKWTLADNYEDYEKYYNPSNLNESYYTKKDILLEELGEFLHESGDKIKYIEKDSKVVKMPKVCPKCGSKMGIFIQGEPVCLCTNKDCKYYAGTVCFDQKAAAKKFNESTETLQEFNKDVEAYYKYREALEKSSGKEGHRKSDEFYHSNKELLDKFRDKGSNVLRRDENGRAVYSATNMREKENKDKLNDMLIKASNKDISKRETERQNNLKFAKLLPNNESTETLQEFNKDVEAYYKLRNYIDKKSGDHDSDQHKNYKKFSDAVRDKGSSPSMIEMFPTINKVRKDLRDKDSDEFIKSLDKELKESAILSESEDNTEDEVKDKVKGKPSPISSEAVKKALESAAEIPDPKKRSAKIREIISSTVGKLSAKIKHVFGNLKLYDNEYTYDGYIREVFPKYLDMLNAKDMYKLKQSIMEHAFTTGSGHKSLSDVMRTNQMTTDKDNYLYNLADKVRKDLSVFLHALDAKYEKARFDGSTPYKKEKEKEVDTTPVKTSKDEDDEDEEETPKKEEPKKKRKSYWDVDVSEEEEEELSHEAYTWATMPKSQRTKEFINSCKDKNGKISLPIKADDTKEKPKEDKKSTNESSEVLTEGLFSKMKDKKLVKTHAKDIDKAYEYINSKLKSYSFYYPFPKDKLLPSARNGYVQFVAGYIDLPKLYKSVYGPNLAKVIESQQAATKITEKLESFDSMMDALSTDDIKAFFDYVHPETFYIDNKEGKFEVEMNDFSSAPQLVIKLKTSAVKESAELLEEKAKIKSDDPDDAGYYETNIKIKGAKVVVSSRYHEEAESQIKSMGKAFKNVEKSYPNVLESVANEIYNEWSKDHGEKLSRKDFTREIYKSKLQNRVIAYKDDYGFVFEFNYSINPVLGGKLLNISIYTDLDGLVSSYKYELESTVRRY